MKAKRIRKTGALAAGALLAQLKARGVDYVFANSGTDFAPLLEAWSAAPPESVPRPITAPHETVAVGMAHGFYLATGRPQAVMAHVNVGLANCAMGLMNAAGDNIPMFVLAGRTPLTERDRPGARMTPIQYGQEMRDQGAVVRETVKWDYEMRYGEQAQELADRAMTIAMSEPKGPVYLGMPREPLAEPWPENPPAGNPRQAVPSAPHPDPAAVARAAEILSRARRPLVICQRGDPAGKFSAALSEFASDFAVPVVEFWPKRNVLPSSHPMLAGYNLSPWLKEADAVVAADCATPWIRRDFKLAPGAKTIHIGPDPLFSRLPARGFEADLAIVSDPAAGVAAIHSAMKKRGAKPASQSRRKEIARRRTARLAESDDAIVAGARQDFISPAFASREISDIMDDDAVIVNELGAGAGHMNLRGPNRLFNPSYSAGLGWGVPAALGALLARPGRMTIACVGDGSYIFANPVACHQVAAALKLPLLTVVMNNGIWNAVRRSALAMYPDGKAAGAKEMPLVSLAPAPDFAQVARAGGAFAETVSRPDELAGALRRALRAVRTEKRQALLDVRMVGSSEGK